jgi:hypothetical protein
MTPVKEVIEGLRRHEFELRFALERDVRLNMEVAAKVSRGFIGHEIEGWAPLSPATMNGFYSPDAGWIKGKIELGYVNQISATDPLLRTGELRDSIGGEAEEVGIGVRGIVGSTSDIAALQEMGTSRIPARPFLGPALMLAETKIAEDLGHLAIRALTPGSRL